MTPYLPPCADETADDCYWDAATMGNGQGVSFYTWNGVTYTCDDGYTADPPGCHDLTQIPVPADSVSAPQMVTTTQMPADLPATGAPALPYDAVASAALGLALLGAVLVTAARNARIRHIQKETRP